VGVRDAQAPARPQLPRLETKLVPQLDQEPQHDLHRLLVSAQAEDLRPDVRVQADEVEPRVFQSGFDRFPRGARLDRETELGVELPGRDVIVRVRLDARRQPQHDRRPRSVGNHLAKQVELLVAVDDDRRARTVRSLEVLDALVVAEEMDAVAGKAGLQGEVELARRDHIQAKAFFGDDAKEPRRCKGLRRIEHLARPVHRGRVLGRPLADGCLVVHVERRAMAVSQLDEVAAAHLGVAGSVDPVRDREEQI